MPANNYIPENELAEAAVAWLRSRLPQSWEIGPTDRAEFQAPGGRLGAAIDLRGSNGASTTMVVEAKQVFGPRDVDKLLTGVGKTLRTLAGHTPILLVAPWLSGRTKELLADQRLNYLDLTGNALIRLDNPTVYIETQGAVKDPSPPPRRKARVKGPKAGRLIRWLVDVRPPYGVRQLASSSGLAISYVSRLLDALDDEALVERTPRGGVEWVDISRLITRWADSYDVFRSNATQRYLAPGGAADALGKLAWLGPQVAVTGSFAASQLAPVAAPALLAVYADAPRTVVDFLGLIPADQGANVVLLTPFDPVVWDRTSVAGTNVYVAPSQAAVDCLTGNGRMPAEGDALLQWMIENESRWRLEGLPERMLNG